MHFVTNTDQSPMRSISNDQQLQLLLRLICESVNSKVELNSKLLRDILDVVEGLMRGALNSKGNYDHSSFKLKCSFASVAVQSLKLRMSGAQLLKATHREHAMPLKVILRDMYSLKQLNPDGLHSVGGGFKRGHFSRLAGPIGATSDQAIREVNSVY